MPKPPPQIKIKRAKAIVDDAGRKVLAECVSCGKYRYIVEVERSAMSVKRARSVSALTKAAYDFNVRPCPTRLSIYALRSASGR
jgi:hypothetical protein